MELETRILRLRLWFSVWEEVTMTKDEWAKVDRLKNSLVELETVK